MSTTQLRLDFYDSERSLAHCDSNIEETTLLLSIRSRSLSLLEDTLKSTKIRKLGRLQTPILSLGVLTGSYEIVECLIRHGCVVRDHDLHGYTPMHHAVWNWHYRASYDSRNQSESCLGCATKTHRLDLIDILISVLELDGKIEDAVGNVFMDANRHGLTPFLLACSVGCGKLMMSFLSILDRSDQSIPSEKLIDNEGNTPLHHFVKRNGISGEILEALLKRYPDFVNVRNRNGYTPLGKYVAYAGSSVDVTIVRLLLQYGACPDSFDDDGCSILHLAISYNHLELIEVLLRAGCQVNDPHNGWGRGSPVSWALKCCRNSNNSERQRKITAAIIDRLLAFGAELYRESYLNSPDNPDGMPADILEKLREVRALNSLIHLQRQCKNVIRRYLKSKADETIEKLTCIPDGLKKFLLVENEPRLLEL